MESDKYEANIIERVIPVENIQLMLHYKKPFMFCHPDGTYSRQPLSIVGGLSNSFFDAKTNGETGVIFVSFTPVGACCFFDFPLVDIKNQNIDLADIYHKETNHLEELLHSKRTVAEKIEVVEHFLVSRFSSVPQHDYNLIEAAVDIIKQNKGQLTTGALAEKLSVTDKKLERKFSQFIGLTPKRFANLIRFQYILLDIHKNFSLTECSYRHGYFDQSHFIKDFKMFSGHTPGEYIEKMADCSNISTDFSPL